MEISEQALSRMMADAVARISRDAQGPSVSRMEATVVSVASDGSMTLNRGTPERPQMLYGVRSLTSAAGAASGDIAVVETFDHVSYVIGTVATKSGRSHGLWTMLGQTISTSWTTIATIDPSTLTDRYGALVIECGTSGPWRALASTVVSMGDFVAHATDVGSQFNSCYGAEPTYYCASVYRSGSSVMAKTASQYDSIQVWGVS